MRRWSDGPGAGHADNGAAHTFTTSRPGPEFSPAQLTFAAVASVVLYGVFVVNQTVRHRDFFLPVLTSPSGSAAAHGTSSPSGAELPGEPVVSDQEEHADPPTVRQTVTSLILLLVSLVAVVGLAKVESPSIEHAVAAAGLPASFVGVVIALLVLAPETLAGVRAARRNRVQTSLNLAFGSAIASIGLTIPVVATPPAGCRVR